VTTEAGRRHPDVPHQHPLRTGNGWWGFARFIVGRRDDAPPLETPGRTATGVVKNVLGQVGSVAVQL
jgi:hypothetical protein